MNAQSPLRPAPLRPERAELPSIPLVTAQVADITDEREFPEIAIVRAYARGEQPSAELIAQANARLSDPVGRDAQIVEGRHG